MYMSHLTHTNIDRHSIDSLLSIIFLILKLTLFPKRMTNSPRLLSTCKNVNTLKIVMPRMNVNTNKAKPPNSSFYTILSRILRFGGWMWLPATVSFFQLLMSIALLTNVQTLSLTKSSTVVQNEHTNIQ